MGKGPLPSLQMNNKQKKRCPILLAMRKIQIKATRGFTSYSLRCCDQSRFYVTIPQDRKTYIYFF